ncbi:alpha/beta hydrolase [Actinomycetes bacterium KLBMP 9759]
MIDPDLPPKAAEWGHGHVTDHAGHRMHYTRGGHGPTVVCLHGWPGFWYDYRRLRPLLEPDADVIALDLRGFGGSDRPDLPLAEYTRAAQAAAVLSALEALGVDRAVLVGYDVGSGVAVQIARESPARVAALVLGNPMHPGAGTLALEPERRGEFWYQDFHLLDMAEELIDGDPRAVRAYLRHFYGHWGERQEAIGPAHLDAVVRAYQPPGAFRASVNWYRAGASTIPAALAARDQPPLPPVTVPAEVLWGEADPVFPPAFAAGLAATLPEHRLTMLPGVGHFGPLEAAADFAAAVRRLL